MRYLERRMYGLESFAGMGPKPITARYRGPGSGVKISRHHFAQWQLHRYPLGRYLVGSDVLPVEGLGGTERSPNPPVSTTHGSKDKAVPYLLSRTSVLLKTGQGIDPYGVYTILDMVRQCIGDGILDIDNGTIMGDAASI